MCTGDCPGNYNGNSCINATFDKPENGSVSNPADECLISTDQNSPFKPWDDWNRGNGTAQDKEPWVWFGGEIIVCNGACKSR
jgi:hypothetical protein